MSSAFLLDGATRADQSVTPKWTPAAMKLIDGVEVQEVLHVPRSQGYLTEIARTSWLGTNHHIDQVFQVVLPAGAISAWHAHEITTDRLFISNGLVRIALYDSRENSPTFGVVNEFRFGTIRPALVTVPAKVWHGVQNIHAGESTILNLVDRAYTYEQPDSWRLPADSSQIPFSF